MNLYSLIQDKDVTETLTILEQIEQASLAYYSAGSMFFMVAGAFLVSLAGLGILYMITIIAPGISERCSGTLREKSFTSFLIGLPAVAVIAILCNMVKANPAAAFIVLLMGGGLLLVGWTAASEDLGRRLFWVSGREGTRATHLASGWMVFVFAASFPFIGWFLVLPYVTASGLGSVALAIFTARRAAPRPDVQIMD